MELLLAICCQSSNWLRQFFSRNFSDFTYTTFKNHDYRWLLNWLYNHYRICIFRIFQISRIMPLSGFTTTCNAIQWGISRNSGYRQIAGYFYVVNLHGVLPLFWKSCFVLTRRAPTAPLWRRPKYYRPSVERSS